MSPLEIGLSTVFLIAAIYFIYKSTNYKKEITIIAKEFQEQAVKNSEERPNIWQDDLQFKKEILNELKKINSQ